MTGPGRDETPKTVGRHRPDMSDDTAREGRFLVTDADEASAVLKDVDRGQVHTLADNPGVEAGDVIEGAVEPEPPMEVTYALVVTVASTANLSGGTITFVRSVFILFGFLVVAPLVAPVLFVARHHRRAGGDATYDAGLGAAGVGYLVTLYCGAVASMPAEFEVGNQGPTTQERAIAADQPDGELTRRERAGDGELHVLTVPDEETEAAAADVLDDEATLARAARLGVGRVEVRSEPGVISVRYLP